MKILVISNMYPSETDPVYGTFVHSFVESIRKRNKEGSIQIIVIKGRSKNVISKFLQYIKFYGEQLINLIYNRYDIIYVHTITYTIPPIWFVALFKKLPLIFNVHGGDVLTRGKIAKYLKKKSTSLLKESLLIVSPSNFFKDILLKEFPFLTEKKIFISPSGGINKSFYNNHSRNKNETFTIGYISRIDEAKGWDIFLKAIYILKEKNYNIKGIIGGRGNQINNMHSLINKLDLNEQIDYIGPVPYIQLPAIYSQFDLFIFPTCLKESLGLVGLEAMACKVPVIGSKIGGLQDYIIDKINGFFFETGNSSDLSKQIEKYISLSEETKLKMKTQAYNTSKKYSTEIVEELIFNKLINILDNARS